MGEREFLRALSLSDIFLNITDGYHGAVSYELKCVMKQSNVALLASLRKALCNLIVSKSHITGTSSTTAHGFWLSVEEDYSEVLLHFPQPRNVQITKSLLYSLVCA